MRTFQERNLGFSQPSSFPRCKCCWFSQSDVGGSLWGLDTFFLRGPPLGSPCPEGWVLPGVRLCPPRHLRVAFSFHRQLKTRCSSSLLVFLRVGGAKCSCSFGVSTGAVSSEPPCFAQLTVVKVFSAEKISTVRKVGQCPRRTGPRGFLCRDCTSGADFVHGKDELC